MASLPPRVIAALRVRVLAALEARERPLVEAGAALAVARAQGAEAVARARRLERELDALSEELTLWRSPYTADMRIHAAWLRHPAAPAVFARHHLPACDRCAVRFDESIGEAAAAYGLDLGALLEELNALLIEG